MSNAAVTAAKPNPALSFSTGVRRSAEIPRIEIDPKDLLSDALFPRFRRDYIATLAQMDAECRAECISQLLECSGIPNVRPSLSLEGTSQQIPARLQKPRGVLADPVIECIEHLVGCNDLSSGIGRAVNLYGIELVGIVAAILSHNENWFKAGNYGRPLKEIFPDSGSKDHLSVAPSDSIPVFSSLAQGLVVDIVANRKEVDLPDVALMSCGEISRYVERRKGLSIDRIWRDYNYSPEQLNVLSELDYGVSDYRKIIVNSISAVLISLRNIADLDVTDQTSVIAELGADFGNGLVAHVISVLEQLALDSSAVRTAHILGGGAYCEP